MRRSLRARRRAWLTPYRVHLGQRVLVLSAAPATVLADLPIGLPDERDQLGTRSRPEFLALRGRVYELVQRAKRG